jgi:hypothetical protein
MRSDQNGQTGEAPFVVKTAQDIRELKKHSKANSCSGNRKDYKRTPGR